MIQPVSFDSCNAPTRSDSPVAILKSNMAPICQKQINASKQAVVATDDDEDNLPDSTGAHHLSA